MATATAPNPAMRRAAPRAKSSHNPPAYLWLQGFLFLQMFCQLALLIPEIGAIRLIVRVASFGISLAYLVLIKGYGPGHPARRWCFLVIGTLAVGLFLPTANTLIAGLAQCGLYVAILAPLFWVSRLQITTPLLYRVLLLMWAFQTISAFFGVLQVLYPGQYQPKLSSTYASMDQGLIDSMKVELADGQKIFRPMGLTDIPGGAAGAGMYSALISIGIFLRTRNPFMRLVTIGTMGMGLFCIYLSQTRSVLIMTGVCALSILGMLVIRGEWNRLVTLVPILACVIFFSFVWAVAVGGNSVVNRLSTLTSDRADTVYYSQRGIFLEHTVNVLMPDHPFGAGLGRWGMTHNYFGDSDDPNSKPFWVEIQLTGWLLDGGLPLIFVYSYMVILACVCSYQIAMSRLPGDLTLYANVILAYDIGVVALTFNYPVFISSAGVDFWLLNALLFGAAATASREARLRSAQDLRDLRLSNTAPETPLLRTS